MKIYNELLREFKKGQTGYSTIAIIGQSCIGSVAVMLALKNEMPIALRFFLVLMVTILCMAYNAAVLAHLKAKITFNLLIMSVVFSVITIAANLI
ncbi:hypothetical protein KCTC52924_02844 [Arenibacter antarcticus]|uniref:Uncharacterized protein n=1 Tax=Arenibacter antarcticus TaxID=2040469 RepID=A0ABW5VI88_9FLAO|nr:hypothetical protein [Arenibacter sp. H213]MCM4167263.1 hypothetical protein [Arenibacter sp. H213]